VKVRRPYNCWTLARWATPTDQRHFQCKDSERVFLSAAGGWCLGPSGAVCFLTEKAATIHRNRLPAKKSEGLQLVHCSGEM